MRYTKKLFFVLLLFISCTSNAKKTSEDVTVFKGHVVVIGNEPFTAYGIDIGNGQVVRTNLKTSEVKQGQFVTVRTKTKNEKGEYIVLSFEIKDK